MYELEQTERMLYPVQVSNTPRPSGNSIADTQIQFLKLMDMDKINNTLREMDRSAISNYYGYEDWRDDLWEILPACDTRNSDPTFFDTTWKNHGVSNYSENEEKGKTLRAMLLYAVVLIAVFFLLSDFSLKKLAKLGK